MDVRQYWLDVDNRMAEIASKYSDGVVHLVSRHNREKNTTAGTIMTANLQLAAECLVNNTHDLATSEQVAKYRKDQSDKKRQILLTERSKKQEFVMVVDRNEAESRSIPIPEDTPPSRPTAAATNK